MENNEKQDRLVEACKKGELHIVKSLIDQGANLDGKYKYHRSPLNTASLHGQYDIVSFLIDKGADINIQCIINFTPLHNASIFCDIKVIKLLLENGADPTIKSNSGQDFLSLIKDDQKRKSIEEFLFEMNTSVIKG